MKKLKKNKNCRSCRQGLYLEINFADLCKVFAWTVTYFANFIDVSESNINYLANVFNGFHYTSVSITAGVRFEREETYKMIVPTHHSQFTG